MIREIEQALHHKIDSLRAAESAAEWRFYQGKAPGAHRPDFDDSTWTPVRLHYTWVGAAGDAWFRRSFSFPATIEGIATAGAQIELPILVPIHSEVYVDGVERAAEPSWLDTRAVPLVLSENYRPGQKIQVTIHAHQGDGFGLCIAERARVSALEEVIFRLETVGHQMAFTHYLAFEGPKAQEAWQKAWHKAAEALDLAALAQNDWPAWWASVERAREALAPLAAEAKTYTTHLVAHSHIDMNWLWTWEETVDVIRRDFLTVDALMERYPDFHFSHSQASTYHAMEERHPEVLERVRRRVAEGRWEVTASTWVEGDLNMECGESLARHLLLTRPYIQKLLGVRPRICWEPDTFGHAGTLPQLLQQAGIEYYYFCRAGKGQSLFWWEGLDGSRVLAFNDPLGYSGVIEPRSVAAPALDLARRYGLKRGLFLYGMGDHGGGATARDIEAARLLDQTPLLPRAKMSDLISFYDAVKGAELPTIRGELNTTFEGCYTTHGDIKKLNRSCENALLTAEALSTLAATQTGAAYPLQVFDETWRTVLFHHFHDILCGCAIGATYREAAERLQPALAQAMSLGEAAAAQLSRQVATGQGTGPRCVVWNPLAWPRSDVVRLPKDAFGAPPQALVDDAGRVTPVQVAGEELLFIARDVPALGCRVYRPTEQAATSDLAVEDETTLQNAFLRFHVHPSSGAIETLYDLEHNRPVDAMSGWRGVERKEVAGMINRLQILWEQPHTMSAWNIGDITRVDNLIKGAQVKLVEQGPVRAVIAVTHKFLHSSITQRYVLYAGLRRVDIETDLDWHEAGGKDVDAPMLRAIFKPRLGPGAKATFEVPFAGLERAADGDEVPALRWADVSDAEYGLTLLNNAKYGHQAHGNTLGLTLVRAPYEPDNLPDQGLQSFAYALYPHAGDWRAAQSDRRAAEFNQPLLACMTDAHAGSLQPNVALLECDAPNVMVTAVKWAQSGEKAVIVRLVEMHGREAQAKVRWAWSVDRVEQVNVLEEPLGTLPAEPHGCTVHLGAHKIVTLKLLLA